MAKTIFINLPVHDVARSTAFYEALGFERNAAFSNEQASAMVWSDAIHAAARQAGGTEPRPIEDQGFLYGGAIEDPDGHIWETMWMDPDWTPPATDAGQGDDQ